MRTHKYRAWVNEMSRFADYVLIYDDGDCVKEFL